MSFAFNCTYDNTLHLYDSFNNHFDSGDMRIKIDNVVESLTGEILLDYEEKNNSVRYIALLDYFYNAIPTLYSIKFESHDGDSIYYVNELRSFSTKRLILLIGLFTIITLHHLINIS